MSSRFNLIAQQLLQKDFDHCTVDELQQYADAHPFLAPVQFLLVKKLQLQQDATFKIKAQKAALYYYQPVAFEAFLMADEAAFKQAAAVLPVVNDPEAAVLIEEAAVTNAAAEPADENKEEPAPAATAAELVLNMDASEPAPVSAQTTIETQPEPELPLVQMPALPQLHKEIPAGALLFEPYHTVDYFASQGIKLSQEELPKDKFGKQLMSFTAWLKTMKKLPAAEQSKSLDAQAEAKVEHLAAHSVSSPEVVTETMAEVWVKQGQTAKAAEVYHKLSLLYPSKKVYFAAKLENLKQ